MAASISPEVGGEIPVGLNKNMREGIYLKCILILLMEEILNHLGFIKLVNNGINYLSTGAGFLPATATHDVGINFHFLSCRIIPCHCLAIFPALEWQERDVESEFMPCQWAICLWCMTAP